MSEAKHTAGPWEIRHRLNSAGMPNRSGRYVILQTGSSLREDFFICEMPFAACRGQDEQEHEANAHLIAAAPDMARAGHPFARAADNYADSDDAKFIDDDATITVGDLREMRAVLAKSRGVS